MQRDDNQIVRTTTQARAGATGQNVRTVLAAGTLGAAAMFVAVYLYFFA